MLAFYFYYFFNEKKKYKWTQCNVSFQKALVQTVLEKQLKIGHHTSENSYLYKAI